MGFAVGPGLLAYGPTGRAFPARRCSPVA